MPKAYDYFKCAKCGNLFSAKIEKSSTGECEPCSVGVETVHLVFDGPPGPEAGRFVEAESISGQSLNIGSWFQREDGYWALEIQALTP